MGVIISLFARSLFHYSELVDGHEVEFIECGNAINQIMQRYSVRIHPKAIFVRRKAGHIIAVWATFYHEPGASRAPYVRLAERRQVRQQSAKKKSA